ncbi:unnamed protein product [Camellia sinensis]
MRSQQEDFSDMVVEVCISHNLSDFVLVLISIYGHFCSDKVEFFRMRRRGNGKCRKRMENRRKRISSSRTCCWFCDRNVRMPDPLCFS